MTSHSVWRDLVLGYRKKHALTQADAAKRLNVSQQTISRWESGKQEPDASAQTTLRQQLGMVAMTLRDSWIQRVTMSAGRDYLFEPGWRVIAISQKIEDSELFVDLAPIGKSIFEVPLFAPLQSVLEPSGLFTGATKLVRLKVEFHLNERSVGRTFDLWPVLTGTDDILVHGVAYPFAVPRRGGEALGLKVIEQTIMAADIVGHKSA